MVVVNEKNDLARFWEVGSVRFSFASRDSAGEPCFVC